MANIAIKNRLLADRRAWSARSLCLALLLLLLGGCSAPQLGYNKLDWLASWELRKYVKLTPEQKASYNEAFDTLWLWHRQKELPVYVRDMRALAGQIAAGPLTQEQIHAWMKGMDAHWNRLASAMAPQVCTEMQGFSDKQVDSILQRLDKDIKEKREEFVTAPEARVRKNAEKRLLKRLRRWAGRLDEYQLAQVKHWSESRPLGYELWIEQKKTWRNSFAEILRQRQNDGFCQRLTSLFMRYNDGTEDMGLHTRNDSRRLEWSAFLAQMTATMSTTQREHMQDKLLDLASDFEALAKQ